MELNGRRLELETTQSDIDKDDLRLPSDGVRGIAEYA